jgi:hypothetical protein
MTKQLRPKAPNGTTAQDREGRIEVPLHGSESIVSLLMVGTGIELKLPPKNTFRAGRGSTVDIQIPDVSGLPLVSREHVEFTRQGTADGTWLQVVDLGSTHGTSFKHGRERDFAVRAGERFRVADVELLVLDKALVRLRRTLGGFFGYSNHAAIDEHLSLGADDDPVVLIGPRGSERGHLALAIHQSSRRRSKHCANIDEPRGDKLTHLPTIEAAKHGTVFVSLDKVGPRSGIGPLVSLLFDPAYNVRPILAARDITAVTDALAQARSCLRQVTLPPVSEWRADVPALIDVMMEDDFGSPHRVAELARDRVAALAAHTWKENRVEVRRAARRLDAYLRHGRNMTAAANSIDEDYETYRKGLKQVGIRRDD